MLELLGVEEVPASSGWKLAMLLNIFMYTGWCPTVVADRIRTAIAARLKSQCTVFGKPVVVARYPFGCCHHCYCPERRH